MAGTLALNVEILGQFNKLTTATNGAKTQLDKLGDRAKKISGGMRTAFAGIGVGISFMAIKNAIEEVGKAAIDEAKSMEILSIAMQNTGKADGTTVKAAEDNIKAMSLESAVADDVLRPAFQKLFIATGDVTKSSELMQVALDTSAATGKDLDTVTQAMARSLGGSDTALNKLVPSLRGVDDPLGKLGETFKGAASAAANLDPYQRMNVAFGEIQESIGAAVMPALNGFATFMVDSVPKVQAFFDALLDPTTDLGDAWADLGGVFKLTMDEFSRMLDVFGTGNIEFEDVLDFVTQLTAGFGQLFFMVGRVADIIGAVLTLNFDKAFDLASGFGGDYERMVRMQNVAVSGAGSFSTPSQYTQNSPVVINVNNGNITAQEIANKVNRGNRSSGSNLIRGVN
jgi:tetrahydromethanopterin S-methyltransferase subunit B